MVKKIPVNRKRESLLKCGARPSEIKSGSQAAEARVSQRRFAQQEPFRVNPHAKNQESRKSRNELLFDIDAVFPTGMRKTATLHEARSTDSIVSDRKKIAVKLFA